MTTTSDQIYVIQSKKTESGSDRVYDPDNEVHSDKMVSRKWIMVAGVKLTAIPNKLYDSGPGDFMIIAYNKKDNKVITWWKHTKKEGSNIGFLHLIFNSYIVAGLICVGLPFWFVYGTGQFSEETMSKIYAGSALAIALAYVFGYFEWKKKIQGTTAR